MKKGKETEGKRCEGEDRQVAGNGYSRINPSIMSSASEFPRFGERLEIIKQSGTPTVVEGGRRGLQGGDRRRGRAGRRREVSAPARVIVRGNKI